MNETVETKNCPFCAETIKAAAKKCPCCNSRLVRYALFRQELFLGMAVLMSIAMLVILVTALPQYSDDYILKGRSFSPHRKDLKVTQIEIVPEKRGEKELFFGVSGLVTNEGAYAWRVKMFELTVSNSDGFVDVSHEEIKDSFVVQPGTAHAFFFHRETILTNSPVSVKARVENARDGDLTGFYD